MKFQIEVALNMYDLSLIDQDVSKKSNGNEGKENNMEQQIKENRNEDRRH